MKEKLTFYSPRICYEIEILENSCNINIYIEGFENSDDPAQRCELRNFSDSREKSEQFVSFISSSCALPVHIPQLAEEFLSQ